MVYLPGYPPWFTYQDIHHGLPAGRSTHGLPARISTMVFLKGYPPWFTCQDIHHGLPTRILILGSPTRISILGLPTRISILGLPTRISTMVYLPGYPPWFTCWISTWFTCQDIHPWSLCVNGQQSPELEEKNKAYMKYRICTFSLGNKFYFLLTNLWLLTFC